MDPSNVSRLCSGPVVDESLKLIGSREKIHNSDDGALIFCQGGQVLFTFT